MHLSTLVEMIESSFHDRVLLVDGSRTVDGADLGRVVRAGARTLQEYQSLVYVGENHPMLPIAALAAGWAGIPFAPLNYRLQDTALQQLLRQQRSPLVITDPASLNRVGYGAVTLETWVRDLPDDGESVPADDIDAVAIILYTSGTSAAPKAALLRHRHIMAYLLGTVDFGAAAPDDAMLIAVPPYHVAGLANMLSNLFAGRRLVYLRHFDPRIWLETVRSQSVTHAMVVPTMLARIVEQIEGQPQEGLPLRSLSYGGAKVSERVLRAALAAFPDTDFVNAYGLTETASTIAVLGPDDHRAALASDDPIVQRRLSSVGRIVPTVEVQIRDDADRPVETGQAGIIYVRGEQIAGEYATGSVLDDQGWFCTRDQGTVDSAGYLYIEGRADDTIIRGGENIAPAEIEDVLCGHPEVVEACVVGVPDDEWGQRIAAVVVARDGNGLEQELRDLVRTRLRGSKTPDRIYFREALPHTDTGKLLRRLIAKELSSGPAPT
jgi:acyl-CoA synthetase (AMP-forming)/AMP-acid ligase II